MQVEFDDFLERRLKDAVDLAQTCGVFKNRGKYDGYHTVSEALRLAIEVWKIESSR